MEIQRLKIEQRDDNNTLGNKDLDVKSEQIHKSVEFFRKHQSLFERFLGQGIKIEPSKVGTFYFDLKRKVVGISDAFYEKFGDNWTDEMTTFAILHELGHFEESLQILREKNGDKKYQKYIERFSKDRAFGMLDNCISDNRQNKNAITRTNQGFSNVEQIAYKKVLFPSENLDFTNKPKHIQFSEVLLREGRIKDEKCQVSPEVREALNDIFEMQSEDGVKFFDVLTDPNLPISQRWQLQDEYVLPLMEKLKKQDLEDEKQKQQNKKGQNEQQDDHQGQDEQQEGEQKDSESLDPNKVFKEYYDEFDDKHPETIKPEDIKKIIEDFKKKPKSNPIKEAEENYAKKIGVNFEDLQNYRRLSEQINNLKNPETGESLVDEMESLFRKIISRLTKKRMAPKYPQEEGDYLVDPAEAIAEAKAGNLQPKVWESVEFKELKGEMFGEIELTLVCDFSGSMRGVKQIEQTKAIVLIMETLKRFTDITNEGDSLDKNLKIKSEIYKFGKYGQNFEPIKKMSEELTEQERIQVAAISLNTNGPDNNEHEVYAKILERINDETKQKIKDKELKKIIICLTDGIADDVHAVQKVVFEMRQSGIAVAGVGILEQSTEKTYAPDARTAKSLADLCPILTDILKEQFHDL